MYDFILNITSKHGDDDLLRIESDDGAWYCTNCKADCGLCSYLSSSPPIKVNLELRREEIL